MSFARPNLDDSPATRRHMLDEFDEDARRGASYLSKYQTVTGHQAWLPLLRGAIESHDDRWLADEAQVPSYWQKTYQRRKPKGGFTDAAVPVTAPATLAEGEFQRYYLRGLCLRAIEEHRGLVATRGKHVAKPRADSEALIGSSIDPTALLRDLRKNVGIDTHLGLPAGPNSGMSAELT